MPKALTFFASSLLCMALATGCSKEDDARGRRAAPPPAAETAAPAPTVTTPVRQADDPHSRANVEAFRTRHIALDLSVDFERRQLAGTAELDLERIGAGAPKLVLDTRDLQVEAVAVSTGEGPWTDTPYALGERDAILGSALSIDMPADAQRVRITYRTSPQASALQWLTPEQTADRKAPFLFTQSEAIHARSWIPCQDTPGVRAAYDAHIRTPANVLAVMSAENEPDAPIDGDYRFAMPQPIPSYLIALAVGDIAFRSTGPRTGVYAEPGIVDAAAREFEDTEAMLQTAEGLYGPYAWGRYDLIILPPSFPYGGMENPRLTFATPTVIAGDKSLVSLVAHEMAHSWSGNLVTNATWRDFWLNEGFTSYFTNRIMEAVYGPERAEMEQVLSAESLRQLVQTSKDPATLVMAPEHPAADPDDAVGPIAYDRGSLFLYNLEQTYGRERFDDFLKSWFQAHRFQSATTEQFMSFLDDGLIRRYPGRYSMQQARAWVYESPLPKGATFPKSAEFDEIDQQRDAWLAGTLPTDELDADGWNVLHWQYFLDRLPGSTTTEQLSALDQRFALSRTPNRILARSWFIVAIDHHYQQAYPAIEEHLRTVGRMYLITPLYRGLLKTPEGLRFAKRVYATARPGYHPIAQTAIDRIFADAEPTKS